VSVRTPLCDLLGIDVPILNVGFGASATPELAAAVSNAGGLGMLGLGMPAEGARERIARTRQLTRRPFGGNIIIAAFGMPEATEQDREKCRRAVDLAIAEHVPVLILFWGDPAPFVGPAHRAGTRLLVQVGSPEEALAAKNAGVDAVILQGSEAGGHVLAKRSIWETLPATVQALGTTPVLASGGIADGRTIARALKAGAQGVSLGTRFVACEEAWIHPHYKRRIVAATAEDTDYSEDLFDGGWPNAPHRFLKNRTYREWVAAGRPPSGKRPGEGERIGTMRMPWADVEVHRYDAAMLLPTFDGDPEDFVMWAGRSVDQVKDLKPAREIVRDLVRETEGALAA
jgi:NAD(P)H-dependent flavin oxidoreductase YrpB (nitropropane dioxygenase family)